MRRPASLLVLLVLLASCGGPSAPSPTEPAVTTEPTTTGSTGTRSSAAAVEQDGVRIVDVIDGDTVAVETRDGPERVRLIGINAPERGECLAEEATRRLRELVAGEDVELVADRTDRDQYGRLLRYAEVDGFDVGGELVRAGLALAREYPPDTARSREYEAAQRAAEDAGAGMWAADACGSATSGAEVVIDAVHFDADGDDNGNLNDEWVRITNRGGSAVDLTGWVLKDTSATHRYSFPSGFVLDASASVTVRTGCGTDSAAELHWCNEGSAVWNNSGDVAFLLDPVGNIVASRDR